MAAASIIVDLLMRTGSLETDTQRASRSFQRMSKDAKASANAIASEFKRVQDAIAKAGMTANQQKLFDLKGLGASQQQLKAYARNLDELDRKTKQFATTNQTLSSSVKGFIGVVGIGAAFSSISNLSDSYTKFTAQLKNATSGAQEFGQAYGNIQRIAATSQTDIESIGTVYARLSNATKDLGISQGKVSSIVETLSLALKVNGASAAEASSTMLQLSQAFGKGKLDGDEFRTAMEAAPNVMRALAASMGVPFGALKDLGSQGQITADIMVKAFSDPKLLSSLREQAKDITTISGGYTEIKNQLVLLVGEENNSIGVTSAFAKALGLIADAIERIRKAGGVDIGLASFVPGGQALGIVNEAGRLANKNRGPSASGQIKFQPPPAPALGYDELTKGIRLLSVELAKIKAQEDEVTKSFNAGKITAVQYKEIMAALAKEKESLTAKSKNSTRAIKEEDTALKEFAKQQQEIANLIQKAQAAASPSQSTTESLQAELDAYTRLTPAVRDYVQSLITAAKAKEQFAEMDKLMEEAHERELEALIESQDQQIAFEGSISDYVDSVTRAIDPTIELADNIGKLQSALSLGIIDQDQFDQMEKFLEESANKNKEVTDEITEFWKEAAHNMQDAMSDFFFDAMQGNLNDLAGNFKRTIDRMVSDLLASQLSDFLFGGEFGKSGELGGVAGDFFSGLGGFFGDLLPSFDVGTPYVPHDMVANIHKGERILTADENRKFSRGEMGGAPIVQMTVYANDADSFMRSDKQIAQRLQTRLSSAGRIR